MTTPPASPAPDDLALSPSAWQTVRVVAFGGRLTLLLAAFVTLLAAWINRPLEGAFVGVFVTLMALGLGALAGLSAFAGVRRQLDAGAALLALLLAGGEAIQAFGLVGETVYGAKTFYVLPMFAWILLLAGGLALFATLLPGPIATATHQIPNPFAQATGGAAPVNPTPGGFAPPQPQGPPPSGPGRTGGFDPPRTTSPEPTYAPPADRPAPGERPESLFASSEEPPASAPQDAPAAAAPHDAPAESHDTSRSETPTDQPDAVPTDAPEVRQDGPVDRPEADAPQPTSAPSPATPTPPSEPRDEPPTTPVEDEPTAVSPAVPEDRPTETFTPATDQQTASFAPPVPREERRPTPPAPTPPAPEPARAPDPEPGWYPSPDGRSAQWWDGARWSGERRPLSDFEDDGGRHDG
jgi:hypothetical protein